MQWLKTWLMKWLGVDNIRAENSELIQRLDVLGAEVNRLSNSVGANGAAIYNFYEKLDRLVDATNAVSKGVDAQFERVAAEFIDFVKADERDSQRIFELETLAKDGTLDAALAALAALEGRVTKLESTPAPAPGPQGRRGGSAWNSHQVAASAGAARANGIDIPIPTPGVS
jgi:hypothetical protein